MSSCFTVDLSCVKEDCVGRVCVFAPYNSCYMLRKHMTIIAGSGAYQNSTMHTGAGNVNYVSYYVRCIQFRANFLVGMNPDEICSPAYAVLFKVPYKEPVVSDSFYGIGDFILYKEPEKILGYDISSLRKNGNLFNGNNDKYNFNIDVTKPFIVGPNDCVGIFYFIPYKVDDRNVFKLGGSAKVWFDPV